MTISQVTQYLGQEKTTYLLDFATPIIPRESINLPSPTHVDYFASSDRHPQVLNALQRLYSHGRLGNTGYLSILPVDQGVEHTASASFSINPDYYDPENLIKLAMEAGCSGIATTLGTLGLVSRRYAHKLPFVVKLNHNETMTYPQTPSQTFFGSVRQAWEMGACGVGATVYFGSQTSREELIQVREAFEEAHKLGMFTILWCYIRNSEFTRDGISYESSVDFSSQAIYLGVTIEADIIKQKLPKYQFGYPIFAQKSDYGTDSGSQNRVSDHPIDMVRMQIQSAYNGRIPVINSGGASLNSSEKDISEALESAIINKRAGGSGLILGRKAFKKPFKEGVELLNLVQDIYLSDEIQPV